MCSICISAVFIELHDVCAGTQGHDWFREDIIISTITVRKHEISINEIDHSHCHSICPDLQQPLLILTFLAPAMQLANRSIQSNIFDTMSVQSKPIRKKMGRILFWPISLVSVCSCCSILFTLDLIHFLPSLSHIFWGSTTVKNPPSPLFAEPQAASIFFSTVQQNCRYSRTVDFVIILVFLYHCWDCTMWLKKGKERPCNSHLSMKSGQNLYLGFSLGGNLDGAQASLTPRVQFVWPVWGLHIVPTSSMLSWPWHGLKRWALAWYNCMCTSRGT